MMYLQTYFPSVLVGLTWIEFVFTYSQILSCICLTMISSNKGHRLYLDLSVLLTLIFIPIQNIKYLAIDRNKGLLGYNY